MSSKSISSSSEPPISNSFSWLSSSFFFINSFITSFSGMSLVNTTPQSSSSFSFDSDLCFPLQTNRRSHVLYVGASQSRSPTIIIPFVSILFLDLFLPLNFPRIVHMRPVCLPSMLLTWIRPFPIIFSTYASISRSDYIL